jgi:aldose 1-epimerase
MAIELRTVGARAIFEPNYGGRLHQLFIDIDGREEPLLLSPDDTAVYASEPVAGGCYPMAPWPNRVRDGRFAWRGREYELRNGREHALHGLVLDQPWSVVARVGRVLEMTRPLGPGWPWEGSCWQRFEIGPSFLAMKMEVRSARDAFPAGCGWHPWFVREFADADDAHLTVPAGASYELEHQLPTGRKRTPEGRTLLDGATLGDRQLDDCYTALSPPTVTVEWPRLQLTLAITAATPHVQVFATDDALCVEPQTCAPDAFGLAVRGFPGTGLAMVEPGRPLQLGCHWTWEVRDG